jgi:tetratricopeptide (TPR) repeat protein
LIAEVAVDPDFPERLEPLLALSGLAQRLGLPKIADAAAARCVAVFPDAPQAWLWRADLARASGDKEATRAAIVRALTLPRLDAPQRMHAAAVLDALGDPAAAAAALALGPQDDSTLANRAAYLARAEDKVGLDTLYLELQAQSGGRTQERNYLLGQLAELREQNEEALQWYRQATSGVAHDQAQLRIAVVLEKRGDLDGAASLLQAFESSASDNGEALLDAYQLESGLRQKHEQWDAALQVLDRGLAVFEGETALLYARALLFERLDRVAEAEADLRAVLEQDSDAPDALNALGYTLADRTERYDEAFALIERAYKLSPDNPAIIDSMGWVLFRMGKREEALPHLRRAFELQRDAEVAAHLGEALWLSDEQDEARSIWRLGEELDPNNRTLRKTLERYKP